MYYILHTLFGSFRKVNYRIRVRGKRNFKLVIVKHLDEISVEILQSKLFFVCRDPIKVEIQ